MIAIIPNRIFLLVPFINEIKIIRNPERKAIDDRMFR
jgi:hypothetical protein